MANRKTHRLLVVGPLLPPTDGTSVSFELFCREIEHDPGIGSIKIIDSSPKRLKDETRRLSLAEVLQALRILWPFCRHVASVDRVLIFGSNSFLLLMAPVLLVMAKLVRKPCYIRAFGGSLDIFYANLKPMFRRLLSATLHGADGLIVQTELLHNFFSDLLGNKVCLVPGYRPMLPGANGPSTPVPESAKALRLVFLGHVREEKGVFELLESLRRLNWHGSESIHCDIFGPVYESAATRFKDELAQTHNATYKGVLNPADVVPTLRSYDTLLFPSYYQGEGHPGVLIEAMVAGIPVITTAFRSIPEMIEDRVNGLLVPPQDSENLVEAIRTIYDDRRLLAEMARRNWESRTRYDARQVIPLILQPLGVKIKSDAS